MTGATAARTRATGSLNHVEHPSCRLCVLRSSPARRNMSSVSPGPAMKKVNEEPVLGFGMKKVNEEPVLGFGMKKVNEEPRVGIR